MRCHAFAVNFAGGYALLSQEVSTASGVLKESFRDKSLNELLSWLIKLIERRFNERIG